eukprot:COSAG03_NODE_11228_length_604_cov_1.001980_2_plen_77_part_01
MSTQFPDGVIALEIQDVASSVASAVVALVLRSCDQHIMDEGTFCQTCVALRQWMRLWSRAPCVEARLEGVAGGAQVP